MPEDGVLVVDVLVDMLLLVDEVVDDDDDPHFLSDIHENFSEMARNNKTAKMTEKMSSKMRMVEKRARFMEIVISLLRIE